MFREQLVAIVIYLPSSLIVQYIDILTCECGVNEDGQSRRNSHRSLTSFYNTLHQHVAEVNQQTSNSQHQREKLPKDSTNGHTYFMHGLLQL